MTRLPLRLGLTMWSHSEWQSQFYGKGTKPAERLEKYCHVFKDHFERERLQRKTLFRTEYNLYSILRDEKEDNTVTFSLMFHAVDQ